jgi:hypothetical protein
MRTDPTDTGGLFVGRRPGTRPVRYRALPERGSAGRRRFDDGMAFLLLALMVFVNLLFWGPIPLGGLWLGSHVQFWTDSAGFGILAAFLSILAALMLALVVLKRIDQAWILVRRAAGHDQRQGIIGRIFWITAVVGGIGFTLWLLVFSGAELAPIGIKL